MTKVAVLLWLPVSTTIPCGQSKYRCGGLMMLTTHCLEEEDCDKIESVYQLATLKPEKEVTIYL